MEMVTEAFAIQKMSATGTPPPELAAFDALPEPWSARWTLSPGFGPGTMTGFMKTEGNIESEGQCRVSKA